MWSWNQFRNLPKNQGLSAQEQARQYFIHQSNMMMEASNNNAAAAASSAAAGSGAGAGGGTPASKRVQETEFLIFGIKTQPTLPPDDYMLFNLNTNNTITPYTTSDIFYGPTVFADNTDDGLKYFLSKDFYNPTSEILVGRMNDLGDVTYLDIDILGLIGGSIYDLSFNSIAGVNDTYIGLTGISATSSGYGASFDITVSDSIVSGVSINTKGDLYKPGDVININASNFGGSASQNITITINSITAPSSPTSMYYVGENQFICLDRILFLDNFNESILPKTYIVDTYYETVTLLSTHNFNNDGFYPTSLFQYNGDVWGVFTEFNFSSSVGKYNLNTGLVNIETITPVVINNIPGVNISKVWYIISAINVGDRIYCNLFVNDKETNQLFTCLGELNVETGEVEYLYSLPYDQEYALTNITNKK